MDRETLTDCFITFYLDGTSIKLNYLKLLFASKVWITNFVSFIPRRSPFLLSSHQASLDTQQIHLQPSSPRSSLSPPDYLYLHSTFPNFQGSNNITSSPLEPSLISTTLSLGWLPHVHLEWEIVLLSLLLQPPLVQCLVVQASPCPV